MRLRRLAPAPTGTPSTVAVLFPVEPIMAFDPTHTERLTQAFFFFDEDRQEAEEAPSPVRVISLEGCLVYRESWWWDSYESFAREVQEALDDPTCKALVVRVTSPGGHAMGMTETVRRLREAKIRAGKPILGFADELACSAGYGLLCFADEIWLSRSALVGSIGTLLTIHDETRMNERIGLRVEVIASGQQKTDGHPDVPITNASLARMRERTLALNELFVAQVAEARGIPPEAILALEAGVFLGASAIEAGLADRLATLEETIAEAGRRGAAAAEARTTPAPAPAPRSPTPLGAHAPQPEENDMKTLLEKLGLPPTATEAEALAALSALSDTQRELLAITGKPSQAEALGTLRGWSKTASAHADLVAKVEADKTAARTAAVEEILAMAVKTGKRTPAEIEAARASMAAGTLVLDTDAKVAAYKAEIEASPARYSGSGGAGAGGTGTASGSGHKPPAEGSLVTKNWEQMKPMEKDKLFRQNQAAYHALKADWEARGKPPIAR